MDKLQKKREVSENPGTAAGMGQPTGLTWLNKNNVATLQIAASSHDLVWPLGLLNIDPD